MKKSKMLFISLVAALLSACGAPNIAVEKVTMQKTTLQIKVDEEKQLTAVVSPADATDKTLTWSTSDASIATVSDVGVVLGKAVGNASITATSVNGKSATCSVEVKASGDVINVEKVSLDQKDLRVGVNASITLMANVNPIDATNRDVVYSSSDESVLKVTQLKDTADDKTLHWKAKVDALKEGVAEVIVATVDGGLTDKCKITVQTGDYDNCVIKTPTEITVKTTFNDTYGTLIQNAIAELSIEEPNLKVNYVKYSGDYAALTTDVINGFSTEDYPDVAVQYPDAVANFISANRSLNIEPYMDNAEFGWTSEDKNDVYAKYLQEGQNYIIPGTYSLPAAKSTEGVYYDAGKLEGINLSTIDATINGGKPLTEDYFNNLTWEELFEHLCPALVTYNDNLPADKKIINTEKFPDKWAVFGYDSDDNFFITLAEQYGYGYTSIDQYGNGHIDFNNDGMKDLMKKLNEYYNKHYITTKGLLSNSYVNTLSNDDGCLFSLGSTGGVSHQFSATNPKDMKVVRIPTAAGKGRKVINQGPSIAFLKHFKEGHTDESDASIDTNRATGSWLFYKKFTSTKFATPWSMTTGYSPIRASVAETDDWLDYCDLSNTSPKTVSRLLARNAIYASSVADDMFSSPVFKGSDEARKQVGGLLTTIVGKSVKECTPEAIDEAFQSAYNIAISKM